MTRTVVFDIEVYRNYFLVAFMNVTTGNVRHFEMTPELPLDVTSVRRILQTYRLISFNGMNFDLPLVSLALQGATCATLKRMADQMINNGMRYWHLGIDPIKTDHIDLMEVAPGVASLKIYGGRLHCRTLQDLPIDPNSYIDLGQRELLKTYCANDLATTNRLYLELQPQLHLRERMSLEYDIDLRSKSDAQVAEAVIKTEVGRLLGRPVKKGDHSRLAGKTFRYRAPAFIQYQSLQLQRLLDQVTQTDFTVAGNGSVQLPKALSNLQIALGTTTYRMGMGGLHSCEKSMAQVSDSTCMLVDRDVRSFYPSLILGCGLKPDGLGDHFTKVYRRLVEQRLAAKSAGDKVVADSLKITINGSFGKFGSPYSTLYDPRLMIQTTLTGQLALLMLIESLESEGISVISANTDGVVIRCLRTREALLDYVVWEWEHLTKLFTEGTEYLALYARDVNNFVAVTPTGYKAKGFMARSGLAKNPQNEIVSRAVIERLRFGTPIEDTIRGCTDVTQFVTIRSVKGGAIKDGRLLGKAVRWYYARNHQGAIHYRINGYTVPLTEGAKPLMELPDKLPSDLDYHWYEREAVNALKQLGVTSA